MVVRSRADRSLAVGVRSTVAVAVNPAVVRSLVDRNPVEVAVNPGVKSPAADSSGKSRHSWRKLKRCLEVVSDMRSDATSSILSRVRLTGFVSVAFLARPG